MKNNSQVQSGILDALAPQALRFFPNYIQFGDLYARILIVTDYPPEVGPAWLSRVTHLPGVVSAIHMTPTDSTALVQSLSKAIGEYEGRLIEGGNALLMQRTRKALEDAQKMMEKMDQEQQNLFYLTVLLMITGNDMDELNRNTKRVENALSGSGMRGRTLLNRQEQGLRSMGPWGYLDPELLEAGGRNMLSETAAASFPFVAAGINDGDGIAIGRDQDGGLVMIDIWKKGGDRKNSNGVILGQSGAGKTYSGRLITFRNWLQGTRIVILDPEREFKTMCKLLGGDWINVAGGGGRINPLQIRTIPYDSDNTDEDEDKLYFNDENPMTLHLSLLRTFFTLYFPNLTDIDRALLEDLLIEVYESKGINFKTDPATVPLDGWPIMEDLYKLAVEKAQTNPRYEVLSILLKSPAVGADSKIFNGHTTIAPTSDFIVLDLHTIQKAAPNLRAAQYFNVLSYVWNIISADRINEILLYIAEAWMLVDRNCPQSLEFMRDTSKRIRKYQGSFWVDSQQVIDFLAPEVQMYGEAILNNPTYKILMSQGDKDLEALTSLMRLTDREQDILSNASRGEGILVAGNQRIKVRIEAAEYEEPYLVGGGN